jgi:predicted DNA binding CopG/RHH family protein
MKRKVPKLRSDKEAEEFLDQDLSDLDFSQFKSGQFEFQKKNVPVNLRISQSLLTVIKEQAKERGVPYTRLMREMIEKGLTRKRRRTKHYEKDAKCER